MCKNTNVVKTCCLVLIRGLFESQHDKILLLFSDTLLSSDLRKNQNNMLFKVFTLISVNSSLSINSSSQCFMNLPSSTKERLKPKGSQPARLYDLSKESSLFQINMDIVCFVSLRHGFCFLSLSSVFIKGGGHG